MSWDDGCIADMFTLASGTYARLAVGSKVVTHKLPDSFQKMERQAQRLYYYKLIGKMHEALYNLVHGKIQRSDESSV